MSTLAEMMAKKEEPVEIASLGKKSPAFHSIEDNPPFIKVLVYGLPGVGKTVFAARAPRPLIIDAEHGTRSLMNHAELKRIPYIPIREWSEIEEVLSAIHAGAPEYDDIDTIVVDSISELQRRVMDNQLRRKGADSFVPEGKDYQENTERMRRLAMYLRDLPKNFVLTSHVKEVLDEGEGRMYLRPDVTPKLSATLVGIMDVVGYMHASTDEKGETTRFLQLRNTPRVVAKSRIGHLPASLENPHFDDLLAANKKGN